MIIFFQFGVGISGINEDQEISMSRAINLGPQTELFARISNEYHFTRYGSYSFDLNSDASKIFKISKSSRK